MDFGVVGLEGGGGLMSADSSAFGSGFHKQERSVNNNDEDDWRNFKLSKNGDDFSASSKSMMFQQKCSPLLRSNTIFSEENHHHPQQQMLSFSSPNSQTVTNLPYYSRNSGYGNGGMNGGSMHGVVNGVRGPFTPSQWMELEHQALIYKYITSNVPIPSYLLNPIRKAFDSALLSSFPGLRSNTLGWGGFHLGFSHNTDPEPGRCRRTDGKKWRCSKDAVADQKYCERHINRGRHRSRKPVEGQPGHSVSKTTGSNTKMPVASTTSAAAVVPGGDASNNLGLSQHQLSNLQLGARATNSSCTPQQLYRNYGGSENLSDHGSQSQHSLRQFMDDCPKNRSESSAISWSNIDVQSDGTQLSISIPMANEKPPASPLKSLQELEATRMGLGLGTIFEEQSHKQSNWNSISWESTMGGPLGEALHSANNNNNIFDCKNTSALNLMTEGWDSSSPRMAMASSPTGVLQKASFGSLSNSSAGSSPRPENNKTREGAGFFNGLLG